MIVKPGRMLCVFTYLGEDAKGREGGDRDTDGKDGTGMDGDDRVHRCGRETERGVEGGTA